LGIAKAAGEMEFLAPDGSLLRRAPLQGRARIVETTVWHSDQTPYLSTRFNCDNDLSNKWRGFVNVAQSA